MEGLSFAEMYATKGTGLSEGLAFLAGACWAKENEGVIVEFTGDGKVPFTPAVCRGP